MKLERFNTFCGVMIRAYDGTDKALFKHCAGYDCIPEKDINIVENILFMHGIVSIETIDSSSVKELDESLAKNK